MIGFCDEAKFCILLKFVSLFVSFLSFFFKSFIIKPLFMKLMQFASHYIFFVPRLSLCAVRGTLPVTQKMNICFPLNTSVQFVRVFLNHLHSSPLVKKLFSSSKGEVHSLKLLHRVRHMNKLNESSFMCGSHTHVLSAVCV